MTSVMNIALGGLQRNARAFEHGNTWKTNAFKRYGAEFTEQITQ